MQSTGSVVLTALWCVLSIVAGSGDRAAASERVRPNIVLISIDSLRAGHLGSYGYPRPTSPSIDRLASEGVLFEVAVSSTSWTLPAHASLFTGLPDSIHGCSLNTTPLVPLLRDDGPSPRQIALSELVRPSAERTLIGIRTPAWKLVARPGSQESIGLWNLRRDPAEERNLYGVDDALSAEARRALEDTLEQLDRLRERHRLTTPPEPREVPEDLEGQLEALGYLQEEPDDD
jgi:arylsulfatase A-like enzyme